MRRFRDVRAHLGVLRLPATRCGLRVSFSMRGARTRLSSLRSRGSTGVLTLGMRHAFVHLSWVVSAQVTGQGGVGYSLGTSLSSFVVGIGRPWWCLLTWVTWRSHPVSWVSWQAAGWVLTSLSLRPRSLVPSLSGSSSWTLAVSRSWSWRCLSHPPRCRCWSSLLAEHSRRQGMCGPSFWSFSCSVRGDVPVALC